MTRLYLALSSALGSIALATIGPFACNTTDILNPAYASSQDASGSDSASGDGSSTDSSSGDSTSSSSGGSSIDSSDDSSGGGMTYEGGDDSAATEGGGEGGGEGGTGCAAANYTLCDDFEGVAPGATGSAWTFQTNGGYTIALDMTQAHSGKNSVHATKNTAGGGFAYMLETKTFPATDFWGRAWIRFIAPKGGDHEVFAGIVNMTPFTESGEMMRFLNDMGGGTLAMNIRSSDAVADSMMQIPMSMWNCYEWHQTPTAAYLYIDGKMIATAMGGQWGGLGTMFTAMVLGVESFGAGPAADVWYDDVAVNMTQIGCN
jgi:hypothetical protein